MSLKMKSYSKSYQFYFRLILDVGFVRKKTFVIWDVLKVNLKIVK